MAQSLPPLDKVNPDDAWQQWEPDAKRPWGLQWAGHLYRRAAFGARHGELEEAVRDGPDRTIDRLLAGRPGEDDFNRSTDERLPSITNINNAPLATAWYMTDNVSWLGPPGRRPSLTARQPRGIGTRGPFGTL